MRYALASLPPNHLALHRRDNRPVVPTWSPNVLRGFAVNTNLKFIVEQAALRMSHISETLASRKPTPDMWSAKEVVGHLIDSASVNHERMLRVALADGWTLLGYPQDEFVHFDAWQSRPWVDIVTLWQAYNLHIAHLVEHLPDSSLEHRLTVGQNTVTLKFLIEDYIAHLEHHLKQVWGRTVQIRSATAADAQIVAMMVREAWAGKVAENSSGHAETPEKVEQDLKHGFGWVALDGERVVASVRLVRHPKVLEYPGVFEVKKLGVLPEYRKFGISQLLMEALLKKADQVLAKEIRLAVRPDQPKLLEFYTQFGFAHDPNLEYSSPNPETAPPFVMVKKLEVEA